MYGCMKRRVNGIAYGLWPQTMPTKLIRKAIEKAYLPKEDWVNYNCRLLHTCGKFFLFYKKYSL